MLQQIKNVGKQLNSVRKIYVSSQSLIEIEIAITFQDIGSKKYKRQKKRMSGIEDMIEKMDNSIKEMLWKNTGAKIFRKSGKI